MVQKAAELPIFLKHVVGATNMGIKYGETASVCVDLTLHHSHPKIKRTFPNLIRMSSKYHLIAWRANEFGASNISETWTLYLDQHSSERDQALESSTISKFIHPYLYIIHWFIPFVSGYGVGTLVCRLVLVLVTTSFESCYLVSKLIITGFNFN